MHTALSRRPDFRLFWTADAISRCGSHFTELALPLTAILLLHATPQQMGLLGAAAFLPFLLLGLPAGAWVDRLHRKPILVGMDLTAMLAVGSVPAAFLLGTLHFEHLLAVAFTIGCCGVIRGVAVQALLPALVPRADFLEANSKLETTRSIGTVAGPSLGGMIVHALGAPVALVVDACSYLTSAMLIRSIKASEAPPARESRRSLGKEIREGAEFVWRTPVLAVICTYAMTHNLFTRALETLVALYAVRELGMSPAELGIVIAAGGPGAFVGSLLARRAMLPFGIGPTSIALQLLTGLVRLMIPAAILFPQYALPWLATSYFLLWTIRTPLNVNHLSVRLAVTPDALHGRVMATINFFMWGVTPLGALAGGYLASTDLGVTNTILIAVGGICLGAVPMLAPSFRKLRGYPAAPTPLSS